MTPRAIEPRLRSLLTRFPAVALLGPRQAGKTTLALMIAQKSEKNATYLDLELPSDLAKLSDPELYLADQQGRLVILDEIHRKPGLFQVLRGLIDKRRRAGDRAGHFLILGSASIDLLKQSAETLAGRIAYVELTPFTIEETGELDRESLSKLWLRGGFPDSYLAPDDGASREWRRAFIQTYLERDIPALGPRVPAETLRRFWTMLAHNQGQTLNAARLASGLGVSGKTVARYLDTLVDLLLVRRLEPWSQNVGKRLVRSPKTYLRDSGVLHALLGIGDMEQLLGHPVAGSSWEGFVIENLLAGAPEQAQPYFYRTQDGAEIDLLFDLGATGRWAVEVKRSLAPKPSRGFHLACDDVQATRRAVVYPGEEAYPIDKRTEAIPAMRILEWAGEGAHRR
jgi:predicted AAA+ superfamily ATPase